MSQDSSQSAADKNETGPLPDREGLAKSHARWRRFYNRFWLALTLIISVGGATVWFFTRHIEHLYFGLFNSIFPLVGMIYNQFFLFNPRRDPVKTRQHLDALQRKQKKNASVVAIVNGLLLLIASFVLMMMGVAVGAEDGVVGATIGGMIGLVLGAVWLVPGLLLMLWWRRSRRKNACHKE